MELNLVDCIPEVSIRNPKLMFTPKLLIFYFSAAKEVKRTQKATTSKKAAPAAKPAAKAPKAPKAAKPTKAAPRVGGKR